MIKDLVARNNKYIFSLKGNHSAMSFETIHGQEMLALTLPTVPAVQRDAPAAPAAGWGPTDWIAEWGPWPSQLCWGKGKETPGDWENITFFCFLNKPGPWSWLLFAQSTERTKPHARLLSLCAGDSHWGEIILPSASRFVFHNASNTEGLALHGFFGQQCSHYHYNVAVHAQGTENPPWVGQVFISPQSHPS